MGYRADLVVFHISRVDEIGEFSFLTPLPPDCGTKKVAKCSLLSSCESNMRPVRELLLPSGDFVFFTSAILMPPTMFGYYLIAYSEINRKVDAHRVSHLS